MAQDEIHQFDIGTVITLTVKDGTSAVDISGASTYNLVFGKPDGTSVSQTGTFTTDGTDGKLYYTTVANDLDQCGWWKVQAIVTNTAGTWKSDIGNFEVHRNI